MRTEPVRLEILLEMMTLHQVLHCTRLLRIDDNGPHTYHEHADDDADENKSNVIFLE